jgi:hypothetical protein
MRAGVYHPLFAAYFGFSLLENEPAVSIRAG